MSVIDLAVAGIPGAEAPLVPVGVLPVVPVVEPVPDPVPLPVFAPLPVVLLPGPGAAGAAAVTGLFELKLPPPHPASRARGNRAKLWRKNSFIQGNSFFQLFVGLI